MARSMAPWMARSIAWWIAWWIIYKPDYVIVTSFGQIFDIAM
jgi:hypothetical protein